MQRESSADHIAILTYHHVGPPLTGTFANLTVSPQQFRDQMAWLADHGWIGISVATFVHWHNGIGTLPRRAVVITFDDAYYDLSQHALPTLERHAFSATVYVPSAHIGGSNAWDAASTTTPHRIMEASQIVAASQSGIEIGSHGREHSDLTALSDNLLTVEIERSKLELEALLTTEVSTFAYPYGRVDERVCKMVGRTYASAVTMRPGSNRRETDLHLLRRTMVRPVDSLRVFGLRASMGRFWWEDLRAALARSRGRETHG